MGCLSPQQTEHNITDWLIEYFFPIWFNLCTINGNTFTFFRIWETHLDSLRSLSVSCTLFGTHCVSTNNNAMIKPSERVVRNALMQALSEQQSHPSQPYEIFDHFYSTATLCLVWEIHQMRMRKNNRAPHWFVNPEKERVCVWRVHLVTVWSHETYPFGKLFFLI